MLCSVRTDDRGSLCVCALAAGEHPFADGSCSEEQIRRRVCGNEPDIREWSASAESLELVKALLRKDPDKRLTIEQMLQHQWLARGGAARKGLSKNWSKNSKKDSSFFSSFTRRPFEEEDDDDENGGRMTTKLRAACFAILLQQLQAEVRYEEQLQQAAQARRVSSTGVKSRLGAAKSSLRNTMLGVDMLANAFREFDMEGRGYLTAADLDRVLTRFGRRAADTGELAAMLEGATGFDREGQRVTYGNYIRLMTHTVKQSLEPGEFVWVQGAPVTHFYALLSGEIEICRARPDGSYEPINVLKAGEYFGENALLAGRDKRASSMRCATPVEILKLSKDDFEAGFLDAPAPKGERGSESGAAEEQLRSRLLGFLQMVSNTSCVTLQRGELVFREGDPVDHFYICSSGRLRVYAEPQTVLARGLLAGGLMGEEPLGHIRVGESFGESSLLVGKKQRTKSVACEEAECKVVRIQGGDFCRLVEKSHVVRESFQQLDKRRREQNEKTEAALEQDDPVLRKAASR